MNQSDIEQQPVRHPLWLSVLWLAITFGLVIGIVLLLWSLFRPYSFHGMVLQSPMKANDFTLTGHNGQPVSLKDFQGQIVLLYFGYTTCPDVCPTTLADLHQARMALGTRGEQIQVLMITVDPARDTQPVLAEYMPHFDSSFIGLTGTPDQIAEVATYYGIYYEQQEGNSALGYLVNHTATVMVIDKDGYLRLVFPFGTISDDIRADLDYLLSR
jgi:protein SCO1/2